MRPREILRDTLRRRLETLGWPATDVVVERPSDPAHGDWATPVPLGLARPLKRSPREIAAELVAELGLDEHMFGAVEVAGPGFVNVRLSPSYLQGVVQRILEAPDRFGRGEDLSGTRINVEFVSSNPTGPLHVGHARNAALGDAISALLESQGSTVAREYYFNDAGRQMDVLGASVHARYQQLWSPDHPFPEEGYRGAYIGELAEAIRERHGDRFRDVDLDTSLETFRSFARDQLSESIREDLSRFRVRFDAWFNESSLYEDGRIDETLDDLREAGAVFEEDGAIWFRATDYGDEKDRVLVKSSGQPTYLLPDLAYHRDKHARGFDCAIDVWGADHHAYAVRMRAALSALGYPEEWLRVVIYQQVSLVEEGREIRISTRGDRLVLLHNLMEEIGVDVTRYFLLMRKGDTHMVFDLDLARRQSDENPVYYVQYAHARIESVFSRLDDPDRDPLIGGVPESLDRLSDPSELALLRALDAFPDVLADAAQTLEPHRVTDYLEGLARHFHLWYHEQRILVDDEPLARARLALARATQSVLRGGLQLLGVSAPESM